jgi:hypothetical protein
LADAPVCSSTAENEWMKEKNGRYFIATKAFIRRVADKKTVIVSRAQKYTVSPL